MTQSTHLRRAMRLFAVLLCAAVIASALHTERGVGLSQAQAKSDAGVPASADEDKEIAQVREVLAKLRGSVIAVRIESEMTLRELLAMLQNVSGVGMVCGPSADRERSMQEFEFSPAMGSVADCLDLACALNGLTWGVVSGYVLINEDGWGRTSLGQITRSYDVLALVDHLASREAALIAAVRKTAGDSGQIRKPEDAEYGREDWSRPMELAEMIIDRAADKVLTSVMTAISREDDEYPSLGRDGLLVLRLSASDHIKVRDAITQLYRTLKLPMGDR